MVIPSGIGGSQPGQSRVKPWLLLTSKRTGHPQQSPREGGWAAERGEAVIYSLYHWEFYGWVLWFWGEFYGLTKDGQLQFKSGAVSSLPKVCVECACVCLWSVCLCLRVWTNLCLALPFFTLKAYFIILTAYCLSILLCTSWCMCCRSLPLRPAFLIECFSTGTETKKNQSINQFIQGKKVCVAGCFYISWMPAVSLVSLATISALLTSDEVMMFYGWIIRPRLILLRQRHYYRMTQVSLCVIHTYWSKHTSYISLMKRAL